VEDVLSNISGTVQDLYSRVHPNENIGNIRFYLDHRYQGSLLFDGSFEGREEIPPQAYYSESHLDTLGICIFIALAKYFNDGNTIILLDDVITSIDQSHMVRFMNVLHEETVNFNQLFITTHYRPWRDRYRYSRGPSANIQLIELLNWTIERGIRHTKTKLNLEEIEQCLQNEPIDRQQVSSKSGILLESLLDYIALTYGCKICRKADPNYTVGELLDSINRRLKQALRIEFMSEDISEVENEIMLEETISKISEITWIRNQVGCHWNISGMDISDSDVKEFAQETLNLANALVCPECGQLALKDKVGSYYQCFCKRKRLYPITHPN